MIRLFRYDLNSEFESNKDSLKQLDNYVALTEDNQTIHLKPLPNIFYATTNNSGTTIYKRTDNSDGKETVTLNNGENKLTDWNYGFYSNAGMKQSQITSFDLSKYDTSNITSMYQMFGGCSSLTSLDLSKFDTTKVTSMSTMFNTCSGLTSLDLSNFDTSKVNNMNSMFYNCSGLTELDLSKFDTTKVTDMSYMFSSCEKLTTLDLSNFDTSKVTSMNNMFSYCSGLTSLDLSSFDTANVNSMSYMFRRCNKLTHIKCKQAFKDWCITNQTNIGLPTAMRNGGGGTWEIVQ